LLYGEYVRLNKYSTRYVNQEWGSIGVFGGEIGGVFAERSEYYEI